MAKSFKVNEDITHLNADGIKKAFSDKIDWKFFNSLQSTLTKLDDAGFEVILSIRVRCAGSCLTVYNTQTSWRTSGDFTWPVWKYNTIIYDVKVKYDDEIRGEDARCRDLTSKILYGFEEKNSIYLSPITGSVVSDNLGDAIYCYQTEIIKKSLNEAVEVSYSKEEIKNLFNGVVNWRLYNYIQYLLLKHEDKGFEVTIRIFVNLMEGYQSLIYSDRNGWSNAHLYRNLKLDQITYNVMLAPSEDSLTETDDWDNCLFALRDIRTELVKKDDNEYHVSYPQNVNSVLDGAVLSGFSIDIQEKKNNI